MNTLAAISVILGILSAIIIAIDLRTHRQSMKIMTPVWVLTGLWAGLFGMAAYFRLGRTPKVQPAHTPQPAMSMPTKGMAGMGEMESMHTKMAEMQMHHRPRWQSITLSTLHCGAGCTLADLIGEWLLYFTALAIGGSLLWGSIVVDYLLALTIGVGFQYAAIRSMSSLPRNKIFAKAFKADFLSLTFWQVGMYGFMAIALFVLFPSGLAKTTWLFWFMMQIAMFCGFVVAFPINLLLIRWGIKKAM